MGFEVLKNSPAQPGSQTAIIVRYHPNQYYGMLGEYITNGWRDCGETIQSRGCTLSKSVFSDPESNYVVAMVHLSPGENCTRLESVEDRMLGLTNAEKLDFFDMYQMADLALLRSSV